MAFLDSMSLGSALTSIDCQCPHKRSSLGFTDKASGLQRRVHKVRRVNEGAKALACEPQPEVLQSNHDSHVPAVSGIGKGEHSARSRSGLPEQHQSVRVTAYDAVKGYDVGVGQIVCDHCEVAKDELGGTRTVL
jgi:hypothetical protein